jgi:hypothetical protein
VVGQRLPELRRSTNFATVEALDEAAAIKKAAAGFRVRGHGAHGAIDPAAKAKSPRPGLSANGRTT